MLTIWYTCFRTFQIKSICQAVDCTTVSSALCVRMEADPKLLTEEVRGFSGASMTVFAMWKGQSLLISGSGDRPTHYISFSFKTWDLYQEGNFKRPNHQDSIPSTRCCLGNKLYSHLLVSFSDSPWSKFVNFNCETSLGCIKSISTYTFKKYCTQEAQN
jgi:hypothetical protein